MKIKTMKTKILLLSLSVLIASFVIQGTLAYYSRSDIAKNVITSGDIRLELIEETPINQDFDPENVKPGDILKRTVAVKNVCSHPFYVRVKVSCLLDETDVSNSVILDIREDWIEKDGWYYYKLPVQKQETTSALFDQITFSGTAIDNAFAGKTINLSINAQALQAENNPVSNAQIWEAAGWTEMEG